MRRLALAALLAALLTAGCDGQARPHLWLTPGHAKFLTGCGSADCGPWSVTMNWNLPPFPNTTGYWLFINGTPGSCTGGNGCVGQVTSPPFTFYGWDCGVTSTLGVEAHDASNNHGPLWTLGYTAPACSGNQPANTAAPAVIDTTLLNNYEQPDTVQASAGSWTNSPTSYTYQFQRCTGQSGGVGTGCSNIGTPQCSNTSATTCTYTLATGDVGNYIVAQVTAANGSGSSSPASSSAQGAVVASRINQPCNNTTALTDLYNGPHLCGWPDTTNVGYLNAPGYPGSLTTASSGSQTCPTVPQSNHTYKFCLWAGLSIPSNLTNVTFYGSDFKVTAPQNPNVSGGSNGTGIVFDYDTFQPNISLPAMDICTTTANCSAVQCSQSYQYGIYNENGAMKGFTVTHSWFWGFGNAIDTAGGSQANPQYFAYNLFTDSVTEGGCGYHNDGIGLLCGNCGTGGGPTVGAGCCEAYTTVDHNVFNFTGNTNAIAWQTGSYDHITNTNNLLDGELYAGARTGGTGYSAQFILTTGNTNDAFLPRGTGDYPSDLAGSYFTTTGSTWNHNYWMVPPGSSSSAATGTSSSAAGPHNGEFILPVDNGSGFPNDCGWVSHTDYPNTTTDC